MNKLRDTVYKAYQAKKDVYFEVFIHKADGLNVDLKMETQRDISQRWQDDANELELEGQVQVNFHLTSIYDHSIFEAFSKVVQRLIKELPTLESILNIFAQRSNIEKVFLVDVVSKIYVATDSSPVDVSIYELICDKLDLVIDLCGIYGVKDTDADPLESDLVNAFDERSGSVVKLDSKIVLYLREVSRVLALVAVIRAEDYVKPGLLEYNFTVVRDSIQDVFMIREGKTTREKDPKEEKIKQTLKEMIDRSKLMREQGDGAEQPPPGDNEPVVA